MNQPQIPPTAKDIDLAGKTIIVTGANAGLGLEAARQYLTLRASRVILAVRSNTRGQEAASALRADAQIKAANPDAIIDVFQLDLDDYESAVSFVAKVKNEVKELDILLCNGAVNLVKYEVSKSGHERVMQVNCYSNVLIALGLLPLLRSTAAIRGTPSHLTIVGSAMQLSAPLNKKPFPKGSSILASFDNTKLYSGFSRYPDSKLALAAYVRHLATLVPASEVIVNDPCPGLVATGFDRTLPFWLKGMMYLLRKMYARPVDQGSRTLIFATTAGPETHGKFLQSNRIEPDGPFLNGPDGEEFVKNLWTETVEDIAKYSPDVKSFA